MHRAHRARALADRGGDALQRAVAHVADREHAGQRRLERQRRARRERRPSTTLVGQRAIGEDEAGAVERHRVAEPGGRRLGADEAEQPGARRRCAARRWACARASPARGGRRRASAAHLGVREHVDARVGLDALDQVVRHRLGEVVAADRERDAAALLRQVDRGLAGRVAAADDDRRRSRCRCAPRGRSPRSRRPRPRSVRGRRPRAAGSARPTRRSPRGVGISLPSASTIDVEAVLDAQARDLARRVEAGAEAQGLDRGPRRELLARDAVREADVVLDARARARPDRRSRPRRARPCRALPTRRTPRPRDRPARCPTTTRSKM